MKYVDFLAKVYWRRKTVDVQTIDGINILQATMLAMEQAVLSLSKRPDFVLVDGNRVPSGLNPKNIKPIIKGDSKCYSIAAASVIAKVTRDRIMDTLHVQYPMYNFASHRGYGVPEHVRLIRKYGPCPAHRRSFKPVKEWFPVELEHTDDKLDNN
jgi:ribonuclease HII